MNWIDLGITTADIYDRESDSELDEILDEEYYPTSDDEESDIEEYTKKKKLFSKPCLIMTEILHKLFYTNYESSDWSESDSDDSSYYPSDSEEDCMSLASDEEDSVDFSEVESPEDLSVVSTETESSDSEPPSKYARIDFEIPEFQIESKGKI